MWLTAFVGYGICSYQYNKKIRPYANDFIYRLEAHYRLYQLRVDVKAKELKRRDNTPLEVEEHKPRCWEWKTNYQSSNNVTTYSTELIEQDASDNSNTY